MDRPSDPPGIVDDVLPIVRLFLPHFTSTCGRLSRRSTHYAFRKMDYAEEASSLRMFSQRLAEFGKAARREVKRAAVFCSAAPIRSARLMMTTLLGVSVRRRAPLRGDSVLTPALCRARREQRSPNRVCPDKLPACGITHSPCRAVLICRARRRACSGLSTPETAPSIFDEHTIEKSV